MTVRVELYSDLVILTVAERAISALKLSFRPVVVVFDDGETLKLPDSSRPSFAPIAAARVPPAQAR